MANQLMVLGVVVSYGLYSYGLQLMVLGVVVSYGHIVMAYS